MDASRYPWDLAPSSELDDAHVAVMDVGASPGVSCFVFARAAAAHVAVIDVGTTPG